MLLVTMLFFSTLAFTVVLVWYYGTLSQVQLVYGSLASAVMVMLSVEIGAVLVLLGAQIIAEHERVR